MFILFPFEPNKKQDRRILLFVVLAFTSHIWGAVVLAIICWIISFFRYL